MSSGARGEGAPRPSLGDRIRRAGADAKTPRGAPTNNLVLTPTHSPRALPPKTIKVHTVDGCSKTLALTAETTALQVCERMATKLDARWSPSYALFEVWEDGTRTRLGDDQKVAQVLVKGSDRESKYRDLVLSPPRLELRQWLFFKEADREILLLEFAEMRHRVLSGDLAYKPQETIGLGALCLQHDFGDHCAELHAPGFLTGQGELGSFVPAYVCKDKPVEMVEQLLFGMHSKLVGMTKEQSALEYLVQVATWPMFGMSVFRAEWINKHSSSEDGRNKMDMATEGMLGVNEAGLHWMTVKKELMCSWTFPELNSWACSDKHFGFVVGEVQTGDTHHRLVFATDKGEDISSLVQGYIDAIVNRRDRSMSVCIDDEEDYSSQTITCRDRAMSSLDLRDLEELIDDSQFEALNHLPVEPLRMKGRVAQLRAEGSVRMTV